MICGATGQQAAAWCGDRRHGALGGHGDGQGQRAHAWYHTDEALRGLVGELGDAHPSGRAAPPSAQITHRLRIEGGTGGHLYGTDWKIVY